MLLLQTLSILLQNIRNQQTLFCLFSNDRINNIISLPFDFIEDDELLGYFVNLLKTISLRLDVNTVQFFFHDKQLAEQMKLAEREKQGDEDQLSYKKALNAMESLTAEENFISPSSSFPLYSEAIRFASHRDPMVRTAVRTLTLNVYSIPLPSLQAFLCSPSMSEYFARIAKLAADRCLSLGKRLDSWEDGVPLAATFSSVEKTIGELEDILAYCNDILGTASSSVNECLLAELWKHLIMPIMLRPLSMLYNVVEGMSSDGTSERRTCRGKGVGPLCSLYVVERALQAFSMEFFIGFLVAILLDGPVEDMQNLVMDSLFYEGCIPFQSPSIKGNQDVAGNACRNIKQNGIHYSDELSNQSMNYLYCYKAEKIFEGMDAISPAVLRHNILKGIVSENGQIAAAVARILAVILNHKAVPRLVLDSVGLLSQRDQIRCDLLRALSVKDTDENLDESLSEMKTTRQDKHQSNAIRSHACELSSDDIGGSFSSHDLYQSRFEEIINALLESLSVELLPPLASATVGWALHNLLVLPNAAEIDALERDKSGDKNILESKKNLKETDDGRKDWQIRLDKAMSKRKASVSVVIDGPWLESIPGIVEVLWERTADIVRFRKLFTVQMASATWVQGLLLQELHWRFECVDEKLDSMEQSQKECILAAQLAVSRLHAMICTLLVQQLIYFGHSPNLTWQEKNDSTEEYFNQKEFQEGQWIPVPSRHKKCFVSFSPGGEIKALLCISDFWNDREAHENQADAVNNQEDLETSEENKMISKTNLKPETIFAMILDVPSQSLAMQDKDGKTVQAARILSVAPILGTAPKIDSKNKKWIHIEVRPKTSTLLQVLKKSHMGAELAAIREGLHSGHWVLAFESEEKAKEAVDDLQEAAKRVRASNLNILDTYFPKEL